MQTKQGWMNQKISLDLQSGMKMVLGKKIKDGMKMVLGKKIFLKINPSSQP